MTFHLGEPCHVCGSRMPASYWTCDQCGVRLEETPLIEVVWKPETRRLHFCKVACLITFFAGRDRV